MLVADLRSWSIAILTRYSLARYRMEWKSTTLARLKDA
jgi:hypothetical protein